MIFRLTLTPDTGSALQAVKLCETTRTLAEMNVRLNHTRILDVQQLFQSDFSRVVDRSNRRNILTFDVIRGEGWSGAPFKDEADAFAFAIKATNDLPGSGTLTMQVVGSLTSWLFTLNNAVVQTFDLTNWDGVAIGTTYAITCGQITY